MGDFLYESGKDFYPYGFEPPEKFEHWKETLIAKINSDGDSDGYDVEIYETRAPARFFKIKVLPTKNSVGEIKGGFSVSTGSGGDDMLKFVSQIADKIVNGMIGFDTE